jgi:hypothetical protein
MKQGKGQFSQWHPTFGVLWRLVAFLGILGPFGGGAYSFSALPPSTEAFGLASSDVVLLENGANLGAQPFQSRRRCRGKS